MADPLLKKFRPHGEGRTGKRLLMLAPPLAALLHPFALEGFNTSVTHIVASGASTLSKAGMKMMGKYDSKEAAEAAMASMKECKG